MVALSCPHCGVQFNCNGESAETEVWCPGCRGLVQVPVPQLASATQGRESDSVWLVVLDGLRLSLWSFGWIAFWLRYWSLAAAGGGADLMSGTLALFFLLGTIFMWDRILVLGFQAIGKGGRRRD